MSDEGLSRHTLRRLRHRLRQAVSLLEYQRKGGELWFAADFSEIFTYLQPQDRPRSRAFSLFDGVVHDVTAADCDRLALDFLFNGALRPALVTRPHVVELRNFTYSLTMQSIALPAQASNVWAQLPEDDRRLLERLGSGDILADNEVRNLMALLNSDFQSICADVSDYVHLSPFRTGLAKLRQLLSDKQLVFCGDNFVPGTDIEVTIDETLVKELFGALCRRRPGRNGAAFVDARALAFADGVNRQYRKRQIVLVSRSKVVDAVVSEDYPQLANAFCSLESFFFVMLAGDEQSASWHEQLEAEITTAIAAIEAIDARASNGNDSQVESFLSTLRASVRSLINQRLGEDATRSRPDERRPLPIVGHSNTVQGPGQLFRFGSSFSHSSSLLLTFVRFVSEDDTFRRQLREESLLTWDRLSSAVDRIRQAGRVRPVQSCFVSYSNHDSAFAARLIADLMEAGVSCWFAPDSLRVGQDFSQAIEDAIRVHDRLVVVVSRSSLEADWVRREVEAGLEMERAMDGHRVIPVKVDAELDRTRVSWAAHLRRTRQAADFQGWEDNSRYKFSLRRLLDGLTRYSVSPEV